jgi:hypothetical protein
MIWAVTPGAFPHVSWPQITDSTWVYTERRSENQRVRGAQLGVFDELAQLVLRIAARAPAFTVTV